MKLIDRTVFKQMLLAAAADLEASTQSLCEIDSRFGDGDHGITVGKIAALLKDSVASWQDTDIGAFLDTLGLKIMGVNGGSAGPLYGTLIGGMGIPVIGKSQLTIEDIRLMMASAITEMEDITTAKVGDKTMMDAFIPAAEITKERFEDMETLFDAIAEKANAGAKASEGFVSKFGRARHYKEQTIGTPDAGAVSTAVFLSALRKGL